jgi:sn-glycerol 3-phosphate transport system ATP-binding protein
VAGFIGSPPMNLLPGMVSADGGTLAAEGLAVRLPVPAPALAGRQVVLGVRTEQLQLGGDTLHAEVEMIESLGADHLIHARAGGCDLVIRAGDVPMPASGARIGLGVAASAMHWFDPVSGQRIAPA